MSTSSVERAREIFKNAQDAYFSFDRYTARSLLEQMIELAEREPELARHKLTALAHLNLGQLYDEDGMHRDAAEHIQKAFDLGIEKDAYLCRKLGGSLFLSYE